MPDPETRTQLDSTACHVPHCVRSGAATPRFYLIHSSHSRPETIARPELSRVVGLNLYFVGGDAVVIPISAEFYSGHDALRDRQIGSSLCVAVNYHGHRNIGNGIEGNRL
jgi:hypothetical protein